MQFLIQMYRDVAVWGLRALGAGIAQKNTNSVDALMSIFGLAIIASMLLFWLASPAMLVLFVLAIIQALVE